MLDSWLVWLPPMTLPGYFWDRWPSLVAKLSWVITTTQVNSVLHPSRITKLSSSLGWGKGGKVTTAGWQVIVCDSIWHVISHNSDMILNTNCYVQFTYFVLFILFVSWLMYILQLMRNCWEQSYVLVCIQMSPSCLLFTNQTCNMACDVVNIDAVHLQTVTRYCQ